jgi:hypothetical protein
VTLRSSYDACGSHLLIAITFHFDTARLGLLAEVSRSLAEYPVTSMKLVILTNTTDHDQLSLVRRLCTESLPGKQAEVRTCQSLAHPYDLAWCHKTMIANEFLAGNDERYTHFIYLEDDIRLSFQNFCYFVECRDRLRSFGLVPAFVRLEYRAAVGGFVASDAFSAVYVPVQPHVRLGGVVMLNMPNPYNPCFILDVELAKEYVASRSFDRAASREVCDWGVRERAAMGLCLENVPPPFHTRYVVPVSAETDQVLPEARISHLPNNYADDPRMPLGKIRLDSLVRGARALDRGDWWPASTAGILAGFADSEATRVPDRFFLVTHHDTIVYLDETAERLRHGPLGIAPLNLVFEPDGGIGRLVFLGQSLGAERAVSPSTAAGDVSLVGAAPFLFGVDRFPDENVGLRANGLYLAADLDGAVRADRTWCRAFEQYCLVRLDTINGLALLQRFSWVSEADGANVQLLPQPIDFGRERRHESSALAATLALGALDLRRDIVFGPARLQLVRSAVQIVFDRCDEAELPRRAVVIDTAGRRHRFTRRLS